MHITKELIEKVAKTARIPLEEGEIQGVIKDFNSILEYFSQLDQIKKIPPTREREPPILRKDEVKPSLNPKESLKNSKHKEKDFFVSPQVK